MAFEAQVVVETTCSLQGTWNLYTFLELLSHDLMDGCISIGQQKLEISGKASSVTIRLQTKKNT